jgi:hypothetical protein
VTIWTFPSDEAIREAQAAYDRGEVTLLEATFLADALTGQRPSGSAGSGAPVPPAGDAGAAARFSLPGRGASL